MLDLVATSLFVANGENALALPDLGIRLGSLINLDAFLKLIQKPNTTCGKKGTQASTSQLELKLEGDAVNLDLRISRVRVGLEVKVEFAPGEGTLKDISCDPDRDSIVVTVGVGLLRIYLKLDTTISVLADWIKVADGPIVFSSTKSRSPQDVTIDATNGIYDILGTVGPCSLRAPNLHADFSRFKLRGLPADWALQPLLNLLVDDVTNPLTHGIDRLFLTPLLETLRIQVAGADIFQLPKATCGSPSLRG